ncbi:MAG: hypothetical protein JW748_13320 [Anaerolineales bacterium]|nr:hypothetical protein [Anaerolineales bacterium]
MTNAGIVRCIVSLAAALIGSACILETAAPTTQIVVVTATPDGAVADPSLQTPDSGTAPTWTLTLSPELTHTATIAQVTLTAGQRLSCVKGPHWILYEWVAAIEEGETVVLTARSTPEWPDYFYARTTDGKECWAFGASSTIHGDPSTLPVREAPPLPTVTYVIKNGVRFEIKTVFIRGKDDTAWGANRLGSGQIDVGGTFSISFTAGFYDVLIQDSHSGVLYAAENVAIGSDPSSSQTTVATQVRFFYQNNSSTNICRVNALRIDETYELHKPADGVIGHGDRVYFTMLAGLYMFDMYRCGDDSLVFGTPWTYIGPAMAGIYTPIT